MAECSPDERLVFEASSGFFLTYFRLASHREKIAKQLYGLNFAEMKTLLMLLCAKPAKDVTHAELMHDTGLTSGGQTKVLKSLEERELISTSVNPVDGRSRWIQISDKGEETTRAVFPEVAKADLEFFMNRLNAEEFSVLKRLLGKLVEGELG